MYLDMPQRRPLSHSCIRDYLICICDYIRYIVYSTLLDPSILLVVLTVFLLRFFKRESVQLYFHTPNHAVLTSRRITEGMMETQAV